jgi:hypothetical protein
MREAQMLNNYPFNIIKVFYVHTLYKRKRKEKKTTIFVGNKNGLGYNLCSLGSRNNKRISFMGYFRVIIEVIIVYILLVSL